MPNLSARLVKEDERRIRAMLAQSLRAAGISAIAVLFLIAVVGAVLFTPLK